MSFLSLKLPFPCKTGYTFSFQVTIKFHNFQARFIINFAILKFCFSLKSENYEKKGHFLATADAAQIQPSSSWFFFFPRTNHYVCLALGKNKSGRSKQFWHIQHSNSRPHAQDPAALPPHQMYAYGTDARYNFLDSNNKNIRN